MAAITSSTDRPKRPIPALLASASEVWPVAAGTTIYQGQLVATDSTGNAVNPTATTGLIPRGVAENYAVSTSDDTQYVRVSAAMHLVATTGTTITGSHRHGLVYYTDNNTVSLSSDSGARSPAGIVADVNDDGVWIWPTWIQAAQADRSVTGAALADDAIIARHVPVATIAARLKSFGFSGRNGAGAITVTGLTAGSLLLSVHNTDGTFVALDAATFATAAPSANTLTQVSASDLSGEDYIALVALEDA